MSRVSGLKGLHPIIDGAGGVGPGDRVPDCAEGAVLGSRGRRAWVGLGLVVAVVALTVFLGSEPGSDRAQLIGDVAVLFAAAFAALSCARGARRGGGEGRAWGFMTVAMGLWTAAQVLWTFYGITLDHVYPFPSLADVGFIGYAVPAAAALFLFPRARTAREGRLRAVLDVGVIAAAVLFISLATVLEDLYRSPGQDVLGHLTGMAYPVVDIMMSSTVLVLTMRCAPGERRPWLFLAAGLLVLTLTDSTYVKLTFEGVTGITGTPLDTGWTLAFLLIGLAPLAPPTVTGPKDRSAYVLALELLPYAPVVGAVAVLLVRAVDGYDPVLLITGLLVSVLVLARQILIVHQNITLAHELERTVAVRTAQLQRLAAIVNSSSDAIISAGPDAVISSWNVGAERLFGYTAAEAIGRTRDFLIPAHLHQDEDVLLARVRRGAEGLTYEAERRRKDGSLVPVSLTISPLLDEHGNICGIAAIGRDITEQRAASEALRESEELSRSVIATAGDAYVQCDRDGLVTEWNVTAETIFGWARDEAIGRPFLSLVLAPDDREPFGARLGFGSAAGLSDLERFELVMVHRSGSAVPVEVTAWTVGTDAAVFSFFIRDIGDRLAAERAKDEFISVVGHELRTPLTSIHGALGLLHAGLLGELNERGKRMVEIAAHNTDRLVRLINDILDIERLNSGKVSLERQECDIAVLGKHSIDVMRPMADLAGVRLEGDVLPATVWADPDRIEQTLTNLLSNAIKFSPPGAAVRLASRARDGSVQVHVQDQGRGIPPEYLELIFDRFQQVDGSDAREKGGTGLGLAICRTIVEQHGGRIWAEGVPGGGARLTFTLPAPALREEEPVRVGGPTLLVCGDDASVKDSIAAMLRPHGYEVVNVPSAAGLLEAAIAHRPALILLDLRMPAADGWQAAVAVRDEAVLHDIPVVVLSMGGELTANNLPDVVDRFEAPLNAGALVAAVGRAITSRAVGPRLLLVEDDEDLAHVLMERFRQLGVEVHHARTAQRALAMCADIVPDLLVLDLCLPDQDGYAVVAQLRRDVRLRGMPLAVYTASDLSEADRKRLRLGKTEFFTKGRVTADQFERHVLGLLCQLAYTGKELHA